MEKSKRGDTPPLNTVYPSDEILKTVSETSNEPILIEDNDSIRRILFSPTSVSEATEFLSSNPHAKIVAGATDIGVQFNKGHCDATTWLDLNRIEELNSLDWDGSTLIAGACSTWRQIEEVTRDALPPFYEIVSIFGSPQIRNVGTLGGNIVNASPIADSVPLLFVCDAELELQNQSTTRRLPIKDFYQDYKKFDLRPGELLTKIRIPLPVGKQLKLYKVSRRRDLDISTFTAAIAIGIDDERIESAKIGLWRRWPNCLSFATNRRIPAWETVHDRNDEDGWRNRH